MNLTTERPARWLHAWTWVYAALVVACLGALTWLGETTTPTFFLLYAPRQPWLLPLVVLVPAALRIRSYALVGVLAAVAAIVIVPLMGLRAAAPRTPAGPRIRLLTYNVFYGRLGPDALADEIQRAAADIVVLQATSSRVDRTMRERFAGRAMQTSNDLLLVTSFPIRKVDDPPNIRDGVGPQYFHYALDTPNGPLDVFNTHPYSPRPALREFAGVEKDVDVRAEQVAALGEAAARAEGPAIIAGDTNLPHLSALLRRHLGRFHDAFDGAGFGFGYTFPAKLPWMRIDRVLGNDAVHFTRAEVGARGASDHRPLVVEFTTLGAHLARPVRARATAARPSPSGGPRDRRARSTTRMNPRGRATWYTAPSSMPPLVSAIVPAYNYARFLPRAVDSVLAQTYAPIECLVVDDGSTDETPEVLARYGERIRVIRKTNAGLSAARNTGAREARGEYLAYLDADDWWEPGKVAAQVALLDSDPELAAVGCGVRFLDKDMRVLREINGTRPPSRRLTNLRSVATRRLWVGGSGSGVMLRASALERLGLFDTSLRAAEDWDMWLRLFAEHKVGNVREVLTNTHLHGTGSFRNARLMEENQWRVYEHAVRRWPRELDVVTRRRMRALILADAAFELMGAGDLHEARGRLAASLRQWPFDPKRVKALVKLTAKELLERSGLRPRGSRAH